MSFSKGSPGSQTPGDVEAGPPTDDFDDGDFSADPFDVTRTKNAPVQRLRRWRDYQRQSRILIIYKQQYQKAQFLIFLENVCCEGLTSPHKFGKKYLRGKKACFESLICRNSSCAW